MKEEIYKILKEILEKFEYKELRIYEGNKIKQYYVQVEAQKVYISINIIDYESSILCISITPRTEIVNSEEHFPKLLMSTYRYGYGDDQNRLKVLKKYLTEYIPLLLQNLGGTK